MAKYNKSIQSYKITQLNDFKLLIYRINKIQVIGYRSKINKVEKISN